MLRYLERVSKVKVPSWIATAGTAVNLLSGVHALAVVTIQRHEANRTVLIRAAAVAKAGATVILSTLVTRTENYPVAIGVCWESP